MKIFDVTWKENLPKSVCGLRDCKIYYKVTDRMVSNFFSGQSLNLLIISEIIEIGNREGELKI